MGIKSHRYCRVNYSLGFIRRLPIIWYIHCPTLIFTVSSVLFCVLVCICTHVMLPLSVRGAIDEPLCVTYDTSSWRGQSDGAKVVVRLTFALGFGGQRSRRHFSHTPVRRWFWSWVGGHYWRDHCWLRRRFWSAFHHWASAVCVRWVPFRCLATVERLASRVPISFAWSLGEMSGHCVVVRLFAEQKR